MQSGACEVGEIMHHHFSLSFLCPFIHSQIYAKLDNLDTKMKPKKADTVPALTG